MAAAYIPLEWHDFTRARFDMKTGLSICVLVTAGRERPEGPSLAIRASTSGLRASKSGDITFSCGCLILKHHTLRAALSSVCNPGGSERR